MPGLGAVVAGVALAVMTVVVDPAGALGTPVSATPPGFPGAPVAQVGPSGRISLASQTPWVEPGGAFELRIDLAGVRRPEALAIEIGVHRAVTSRSQFNQTLRGSRLGDDLWRQGPTPLAETELDDAGALRVVVPVAPGSSAAGGGDAGIILSQAGVHPVRVVLADTETGTEVDSFTTYLVRSRQDDALPLAVAWVQPIAAPPALQPDGTTALDDAARAAIATVAGALGATDVAVTMVLRPETLDALAVLAPDVLDQLLASTPGRQQVAEPYVEIDPGALGALGMDDLVEALRERGAAVVERLLGPADGRTWASPQPVDAITLARAPGVERLVLPEVSLAPLERPLTLANPFLVEGTGGRLVEAAAIDAQLQTHFEGDDPVLGAHNLLADLAVVAYDSPGLNRAVVVQPPAGWTPSADLLATALPALASGSVLRPVTLDQLFDGVPLAPAAACDGDLVRALVDQPAASPGLDETELSRTRADVASFGAMVTPADAAHDLAQRLVLVSTASSLATQSRTAYLQGARQVISDRLESVGILSEGSFRLTSREATIPLTLVNNLDVGINVTLELKSDKLDFVGGGERTTGSSVIPLELEPGSTPIMVPVETRTPGDFSLVIELRSPDGRLDVASTRLTVRSTSLSGVGLAVSAGAGIFLCGWWARHWRSARRARRLVAPPSA